MTNQEANDELFGAISAGDLKACQSAIKNGADVNADDYGRKPLHNAARKGYAEIAKLLIDKGADTSAGDLSKQTPLHLVASNGHAEVAKLLIACGANVNAKDENRATPLAYAQEVGHTTVAAILADAMRKQTGHADRIDKQRDASSASRFSGYWPW